MVQEPSIMPDVVKAYLHSRPRWIRWREWLVAAGTLLRHSRSAEAIGGGGVFPSRCGESPRDGGARFERGLGRSPPAFRDEYEEILNNSPKLVIVQFRRTNICGCLGHAT